MSKELQALIYGLLLGCLTIGLGGVLVGTSAVPGIVFTSIAILGFVVFHFIRRNHE